MKATNFTETAFNSCSDNKFAAFTTNERRWITKINKLAAAHHDEVRGLVDPDSNDGYLYCQVPKSWLKISPPRKTDYFDEQRAEMSERAKRMVEARILAKNNDEM